MNSLNGNKDTLALVLNITLAVVIVSLSFLLFANSMTKDLGHDEHMYCTAGYLTAGGELIYRDFSYVAQLPYHPLVLALLYKVTGTTHYLLFGRLLSVVCEIGILICIAGICKSVLRRFSVWSAVFALAGVIIYAMNPFVIYASGYAWNHSMVTLCVLGSLWLFLSMDFSMLNFRRLCAIGALLAVATFTRPTAALVYVIFSLAVMFIAPGRLKKGKATALPFIIGSFVFSIWPLMVIMKAPEACFLNVFRIPALNATFLNETGWVHNKVELTKEALLSPAYIGLIILAIYFGTVRLLGGRAGTQPDKRKERLSVAIAGAFVVSVFIPPTMWRQYWAMPLVFIIVCLAYPFGRLCDNVVSNRLKKSHLTVALSILVLTAAVSLYASLPFSLKPASNLFDGKAWVPLQVHKISKDIREGIVADGPVLTLSPLYAIEGGSDIYLELSDGPFVYRIADDLSDKARQFVHAAGISDLKELIECRKPSAVILGTEPPLLENPIYEQVVGADWEKKVYGENGLVVYFRKSDDGGPDVK